jgi:gliding motility-associated-like protein
MKPGKAIPLIVIFFTGAWVAVAQCNFQVSMAGKEVRCFGEANGEARVSIIPTGAFSGPYFIQWFDGSDLSFRTDLPAGTHFVKVTDAFGCFLIEFITINQPQLLHATLSPEHVRCHGEPQGSIDLTVTGGTPGYAYQWTNGETTPDIANLLAGPYSVTVTDTKGCEVNGGTTLTQPNPLAVSPAVTPVSCFGGNDGEIKATVFGGVQPYRYAWSTVADTVPDVFNLMAGTHTLTVTDHNQCVLNENIVVPGPLPLAVGFTVKKVSCFDLPDGEIFAAVTGGTPPYRYRWSNTSFVLGDTTQNPTGLFRDQYTLEVTDFNGCQLIDSVFVQEPNPLVINLEVTDASCFNKPDGEIDLSISGGTAPYAVLWSNGSRQQDLFNLHSGIYRVTVADEQGCTRYGEIVVGQPDSLDFRVSVEPVSCKDEVNGRVSINPKGGTPGYVATWSTGQSGFVIDQLPGNTAYTVSLTDAQNCRYEGVFFIPVNPEPCITRVIVPNTFTPNNDGINDVWVIRHYEVYPQIEVRVFNRWGKIVHESTGYLQPWDGTVNGADVQAGTYYYTIKLNNGDPPFSGTLTIIR